MTTGRFVVSLGIALAVLVDSSSAVWNKSPWGVKRLSSIPRGGASDYANKCESVKCVVIEKANEKIEPLRQEIIDEGSIVSDFGSKADAICNTALEEFALSAPKINDNDPTTTSTFDRKLEELETILDSSLQVLYLRQLSLLRERALQTYRSITTTSSTDTSDFEAMLTADSQFERSAEESTREGSDWEYSAERSALRTIMTDLGKSRKRYMEVQLDSSSKQTTALQFLQQQQQIIQQLQMQLYGQTSPWNVGVAYRVPDTNFNLNGSYQQGKVNLQLSCVPDEYAPMLGPNGFTNGVGPGNLGLSVNLSF